MKKIKENVSSALKVSKNYLEHEELKNLIKQAEEGEIPWSYEYEIDSIWLKVINKSLQNVSPENWNKIRHTYPSWSGLRSQIEKSNKVLKKDQNGDWKFASKDILEKFKKYTNSEEELTISKWGTKKR